jgi:hypothetical protein
MKRLTSIGAVPEGDNPPAEILLYKKKGVRVDEPVVDVEEPVAEPTEIVEGPEVGFEKRIADAEAEIVKARDERDAAIKALADEVSKARWVDFAARAEKLEALLGPAKEVAPILDALEAKAPDAFADLEKRFTVALGRLELTKELGKPDQPEPDPDERKKAWVTKYVADHPDVTVYKARDLYWKLNPDALAALREEA